jgi:hypothetical protein
MLLKLAWGAPLLENKIRVKKHSPTLVFNIKANSELCNPQKHHITYELQDDTRCPSFVKETHVVVSDLRWRLNEIRRKLQNSTEQLVRIINTEVSLYFARD